MTYVYLLKHATEDRFKVGQSKAPFTRWKRFGEPVKLDEMVYLFFGIKSIAIEFWLKDDFKKWRLMPTSNKDGATEWFDIECWDECCKTLKLKHEKNQKEVLEEKIP